MSKQTEEFLEKSFNEFERKDILSRSKYYVGNDTEYANVPQDIIDSGELPEFDNRGDLFRCVVEVSKYINNSTSTIPEVLEMGAYLSKVRMLMKNMSADLFVIFTSKLNEEALDAFTNGDDDLTLKLAELAYEPE
ncbi:MAG: hypothetical protein ACTSU6_01170 [Candidatus Njordarchaeales archaeon]